MKSFSNLKVLIIDDASIVIVTLKSMLVKIGFNDRLINYCSTSRAGIQIARQEQYDLILCDYNLGRGMNGKQVFEEMRYHGLLHDKSVFILITGESSSTVVHSIIELKPDDYLLKPFNVMSLKERVTSALNRKHALYQLYQMQSKHQFEQGLELCDELLPFYPQYQFIIARFKGEFLNRLQLHDESKKLYESILERRNYDWATIGLANSLMHLGDKKTAQAMINKLLASKPNSTVFRTAAANLSLVNNQIPSAIRHFELASKIVRGNSERELVICNLCLAVGDYQNALERYRIYMEINKETYRNTIYAKLNLIRIILYSCYNCAPEQKVARLNEAKSLYTQVAGMKEAAKLQVELDLMLAHIALEEQQYRLAISKLNQVHRQLELAHFYPFNQFAWLLNHMNFDTEFSKLIPRCSESIQRKQNENIYASQITMLEQLQQANVDKLQWLESKHKYIQANKMTLTELLKIYIEINQKCPFLQSVCMSIIKLLAKRLPREADINMLKRVVEQCDGLIRQLMEPEELDKANYQQLYTSIIDNYSDR
ncbi:tetratricopeptide repeat-containing response regulator [Vibrio panuliri]|uniref:Response regulator n=1 Tax=Vibrio panuliri TaxID=1381081 RepID=A0ABX3F3T1_9VIBR|nr:tetratricopeptide repeat-containing response regulator [Vibrio panuliri]KAB1454037.1 response regulator [Vibrio panuliri]OLQ84451.1 response regulator [Vibrio panuliri]